ncbi:MAG: response regulator, partial [candidate division NC10 bacterium]
KKESQGATEMGNILIADDKNESRARLQGLLESQRLRMITACNLGMAVPMALSDPPDFIFLNMSRSREEAWTVCQALRKSCPKARILLWVEGDPTDEDIALGREAGADEVTSEIRDQSDLSKFLEVGLAEYSVTCPQCENVFSLQERPVPGARVEAQCPQCDFLIGVLHHGPEAVTVDPSINGQAKILVVEDTKLFRAYLTDILTAAGFDVMTAQDGVEALEILMQDPPDLVITDVLMPRMHGFDLCRRIKDHPETASLPVIMMTQVYTREHHAQEARGLYRADDYITKPFEREDLLARIRRFLPHSM